MSSNGERAYLVDFSQHCFEAQVDWVMPGITLRVALIMAFWDRLSEQSGRLDRWP